jgi:hypothetical protein
MKTFLEWMRQAPITGSSSMQANQFGYKGIEDYLSCKETGLVPNWRRKGKLFLYFTKYEDEARKYGTIIVRFPLPQDTQNDPRHNPFYFVTESPIPPEMISVKLDDDSDDFVLIKNTEMTQNIISRAGEVRTKNYSF